MATKEDFPLVCSLETLKHVVLFLDNYAEEHAVALPGRVPGFPMEWDLRKNAVLITGNKLTAATKTTDST